MTANALILSFINDSSLADDELQLIARAIAMQLSEDVAPVYGLVPSIEVVPRGGELLDNRSPVYFSDHSDLAGAAGYHYENTDGRIITKVFNLGGDTDVTASHEVLEVSQDAPANRWSDRNDETSVAYELCDPVESDSYEKLPGVRVSNFVYPAWFDPNATRDSKFDHMGLLSAPGTMTDGGYMILRSEPGEIRDVFGKLKARRTDIHEVKPGLFIAFGSKFPDAKKQAKIEKLLRIRGRKHVFP